MYNQRHNELLMKRVSDRFRSLRNAKGLTQKDVYRLTGIHIGRIEAGNSNTTVSTFSALCKFYEITFGEFFDGIETK